jgi:AcrR family transcriptional regulator
MDTSPVKQDRRIERTRQLLSKALMELIIERGYEGITIQDITDRANVSRTTFYLHFRDKDELLFASMTKIYDGLVGSHEGFMPLDAKESDYGLAQCDAGDFEHVAEYADFYRVMLSRKGSVTFVLQVLSYLSEIMKPALEAKLNGNTPKIPLDLIASFFAGAEVGVMKWWLENDMQHTPDEMARMQFFLSAFGLKWALGKEEAGEKEN